MKKAAIFFKGLWAAAFGWFTPVLLGTAFVCITGNAKGFGADLGAEKDITQAFGVILLCLWLLAAGPWVYWCIKELREKQRAFLWILLGVFFAAALCQGLYLFG